AEEEIGLARSDVNVLGRLDDLDTITNYRVTPIVGQIPWPYPLALATEEVSQTFTIPLAWLADSSNRYTRPWTPVQGEIDSYPIIFYEEYKGEILWGASARMVVELVKRLEK
ncbi:MAG: CoA pyrophosphatase, partial [Chloroflexota bacterium]|nr:CoA pyrophosphatase [Chloroflexota bacterium]